MYQKRVLTVCVMLFSLSTVACFGKCGDDKKPDAKKGWKVDPNKTKKTTPDNPKNSKYKTTEETQKKNKLTAEAVEGKVFNSAFPDDGFQGYKRVFKTEKTGFAAADYLKDGKVIVKISFTDRAAMPKDLTRFEASSEKISGHPYITRGKNSSMVMVNKRFQVKVSSRTLGADARRPFLEGVKFSALPGQ